MRSARLLVAAVAATVAISALGGCSMNDQSHRATSSPTVPTAQSQRDVLVALYDEAKAQTGVTKWQNLGEPYPQACGLDNGTEGAMYNFAKFGATVDDSAAAVKKVGAFLESKGMTTSYNTETINNVTQYRVLATGGGVRSISFTADSTKTSLIGVSACGTGKESDLAGQ